MCGCNQKKGKTNLLIIHLLSSIVCIYVLWRFVWPLPVKPGPKGLLTLVIVLVSQHHLIGRTFFGTLASPEMPFAVLVALGWLFGAYVLLAAFLLLKDVAAIMLWGLRKAGVGVAFPFSAARASGILLGGTLVLSAIGVWQAVRVPDVRTVEIFLPRLPAELDGFRLVQLTDLHVSRLYQAPWVKAVVEKTNALNPDLILMTGDLIDGTPQERADDVSPLRDLKAREGVFAVPGNHEYYAEYQPWLSAFSSLGLRMLLNEHVVVPARGQALVIAGVTDRAAARFGAPLPDIQAALSGAPRDAVTILLDHQPRGARTNAGAGVDLQLSGHTHGGQIPGIHCITRAVNGGFVSGIYTVGGMQLYVSRGAGLWPGLPLRLGLPSEITEIVLRSGSDKKPGSAR